MSWNGKVKLDHAKYVDDKFWNYLNENKTFYYSAYKVNWHVRRTKMKKLMEWYKEELSSPEFAYPELNTEGFWWPSYERYTNYFTYDDLVEAVNSFNY